MAKSAALREAQGMLPKPGTKVTPKKPVKKQPKKKK